MTASVSLCLMGVLSQDRTLWRPVRSEWWQREGRGGSNVGEWASWGGGKGQTNGSSPERGQMGGERAGSTDGDAELEQTPSGHLLCHLLGTFTVPALGKEAHCILALTQGTCIKKAGSPGTVGLSTADLTLTHHRFYLFFEDLCQWM